MWLFPRSLSFFFFSSRRRHTRCLSDLSSDVCSSDLSSLIATIETHSFCTSIGAERGAGPSVFPVPLLTGTCGEIGRASCRERVERAGGAGLVKKKEGRTVGQRTRGARESETH